jgi:redox-sensitive bicupin YhaK (pirin superfamily)
MHYIRKASDRGHANFGWLDSYHSFSFGQYYDPKHMGFSSLCVINDDTVDGGNGFGAHSHDNMEIISYVTKGNIIHKDSMGNHFTIPAGDVQRMSAGTGITHSEFNVSDVDDLKFLQIWIQPNQRNVKPSYEQATVTQESALTLLVSPEGAGDSLSIHADVSIYRLELKGGDDIHLQSLTQDGEARKKYLHIIEGALELDGDVFKPGDGIGIDQAEDIHILAKQDLVALWFDLPSAN